VLSPCASKFVLVAGTLILLGGCQYVGPVAIDQGRARYNHIIEATSKEQTFANILRVYHHEPTLFMDVSEVDATTTFSGAASGAITNIGAKQGTSGGTLAGQTGGFSTGVTYSESPLIRYQPLLGQSLVAQLATPVSTDAVSSLYDSSWQVVPLLDFPTSYMTLDPDETYTALNIIGVLYDDNRLELVAEKSALTQPKDRAATGTLPTNKGNITLEVTNKSSSGGSNDALVIYFLPFHPHATPHDMRKQQKEQRLWNLLKALFANTQPMQQKDPHCKPTPSIPCRLVEVDPNRIELRTAPVMPDKMPRPRLKSGAPLMRTYSALGILKNATEPADRRIEFVTLDQYSAICGYDWNQPRKIKDKFGSELPFYTLLPEDEESPDEVLGKPGPDLAAITNELLKWLRQHNNPFIYDQTTVSLDTYVKANRILGHLRRYILVIHGSNPPANAYVAYFDHGEWYYIAGDDEISQKNFSLISLFMTMMAVPSTTPPLAPTISVGGG
jgi:hypothetical protein